MDQQQQQAMRTAIQTSVEEALETDSGSDIAIDQDGHEYELVWENGEARIYHEEEQDDHPDLEFVYRVRVELVAVVEQKGTIHAEDLE